MPMRRATSTDPRPPALTRLGAVLLLVCVATACSSTVNYPNRAAAISTSLTDINQLLTNDHYLTAWRKDQVEEPCQPRDRVNGALVMWAELINRLTKTQGSALLATASATWHADGYTDVAANQTTPGDPEVTAIDGTYRLEADVESDGSAEISVKSCYASQGPLTQTHTQSTVTP
jgi:hypothetical protein